MRLHEIIRSIDTLLRQRSPHVATGQPPVTAQQDAMIRREILDLIDKAKAALPSINAHRDVALAAARYIQAVGEEMQWAHLHDTWEAIDRRNFDPAAIAREVEAVELIAAPAPSSPVPEQINLECRALALIVEHPDWTAKDYAAALDVSVRTLYRNPKVSSLLRSRRLPDGPAPSDVDDSDPTDIGSK